MLIEYFNREHCYTLWSDGNFLSVNAVRCTGKEYRFFPVVTHKKNLKSRLILNHQDYDSAVVELPDLPTREIPQALHWEAVKLFGDKQTLLVDYYHLPAVNHAQKKMVNIVTVDKNYIESLKEDALSEGIFLTKITIPEMIYKEAQLPNLKDRRFCMVITNKAFGKVVIVDQGEVVFSRKFNLAYDKTLDPMDYESLLLLELQRSLDYCERQYRMIIPPNYLLVGDGINESLIKRLKDNVSLNIHSEFPWDTCFSERSDLSSDHRFLLSASYL